MDVISACFNWDIVYTQINGQRPQILFQWCAPWWSVAVSTISRQSVRAVTGLSPGWMDPDVHRLCISINPPQRGGTWAHTHTHHRLMALCPGVPGWAGTRKVKSIWILLKQGTVSGSGIHWAICKSAPRSRQITMPAPHRSVFYRPNSLPAAQPTVSKHWRHQVVHGHKVKKYAYPLFGLMTQCHVLKVSSNDWTVGAMPQWPDGDPVRVRTCYMPKKRNKVGTSRNAKKTVQPFWAAVTWLWSAGHEWAMSQVWRQWRETSQCSWWSTLACQAVAAASTHPSGSRWPVDDESAHYHSTPTHTNWYQWSPFMQLQMASCFGLFCSN